MAGGTITRISLGNSSTVVEGSFEGFYENLTMNAGKENRFTAKVTNHGNPKEPKAGRYFVKGWWTNHKDQPIKRAVYGQLLRFHIEMDNKYTKPGDVVYFSLFDSDMRSFGNDVIKADDPIPLIHPNTKKPYIYEKVNNEHKLIIEFTTTDGLEQWTSQLDQDRIFELYFRCSYVNNGNTEHTELPYNFHDYLQLGAIVIDRYKMPGLNPQGTGIAEDLAYGMGSPYKPKHIYSQEVVAKYIKEYTEAGFDTDSHSDFANVEQKAIELEEIIITAERKSKGEKEYPPKAIIDNLRVEKTIIPIEEIIKQQEAQRVKNQKAIYTRENCYSTKYGIFSTGFDVKIFDNFSDDYLFWDFENTAELYFARGELQGNLERMIAKFRKNEGGIYEDEVLTEAIIKNPATIEYCQKVEDYIVEQLKSNFSKLENIEDKEPYFLVGKKFENNKRKHNKGFDKPAYIWKKDWNVLRGETIALNDIWATEIILKELVFKDEYHYKVKYEVTLWDHFGLNLSDMEKIFNLLPSVGETFVCWFILQHLRGYKPFITKITFEKEFKGSL